MSPCRLMMTATLDKEIEMHGPLHTAPSVLIFRKIPSLFVGWILRNTAPRKQVDHVPGPTSPADAEDAWERFAPGSRAPRIKSATDPARLCSNAVSFRYAMRRAPTARRGRASA